MRKYVCLFRLCSCLLHNLSLFVTYDRNSDCVIYYKYIKASRVPFFLLPLSFLLFPCSLFFLLPLNQTMPVRQIYRFVRNQYEKRFNSSKKESSANPEAPAEEVAPVEAGDSEQAPAEEVVAEVAPEAEAQATVSK